MLMAMVYIRKVRMSVSRRLVPVQMRMGFLAIPREVVFVLMMGVVAVFMGMFHRLMNMRVPMLFRQMQQDTGSHQCSTQPKPCARLIAEQ